MKIYTFPDIPQLENKMKAKSEGIFYTFGNPIALTRQKKSMSFYNYRKEVSVKELYESFLENIESVTLFKTKIEALEYIRSLKTNPYVASGLDICQSAIFTVNYTGNHNQINWRKKTIVINEGFSTAQIYDFRERRVDVEFSIVERRALIPLEGELKIYGPNQGEFKSLGMINYISDSEDNVVNKTGGCVLF